LASNILRVPIDTTSGPLRIRGYTDTGPRLGDPGSFHLEAEWIKQIQIQIALTQAEDGSWSTLVDSMDPEISVDRIQSMINISPFQQRWWEKIMLSGGLAGGESGILVNAMLGYQITDHFSLMGGFFFDFPIDGSVMSYNKQAFYGAQLIWHP